MPGAAMANIDIESSLAYSLMNMQHFCVGIFLLIWLNYCRGRTPERPRRHILVWMADRPAGPAMVCLSRALLSLDFPHAGVEGGGWGWGGAFEHLPMCVAGRLNDGVRAHCHTLIQGRA